MLDIYRQLLSMTEEQSVLLLFPCHRREIVQQVDDIAWADADKQAYEIDKLSKAEI